MKTLKSLLLIIATISFIGANAITITSATNGGNWSAAATWVGNVVPGASDDVVINSNVTLNGNYSIKTLTINSGKTFTSQAAGGYKLTIINSDWWAGITNNGSFVANDGTIEITGGGTGKTFSGTTTFNNVILNNVSQMNFSNATTINGTLRLNNGSQITSHATYGSNSTLEVNGSYSISTNTYLWGSAGVNVPANISIISGIVSAQQTVNIIKSLTVASGATLDLSPSCVNLKSTMVSITNNGTINLGSINVESGLTWNVTGTIGGSNLVIQNNAVVNAGSSVLNLVYNTTSAANCNSSSGKIIKLVGNGQFNAGTGTVVVNTSSNGNAGFEGNIVLNNMVAAGGTITTNTGATVAVNGNLTVNSGSNLQYGNSIDNGSLTFGSQASVTNNGGTTSNVAAVPTAPTPEPVAGGLTALTASNGGGGTFSNPLSLTSPAVYSLSTNLVVNGSRKVLYIYPGSELISNGNTITADSIYILGKITISNTSLSAFLGTTKVSFGSASIIEYSAGNGYQTVSALSYRSLMFSGASAKVLSGTYNIAGNFSVSGGAVDLSANPTINFNGTAAQNIAGLAYKNVTFSGAGNKTLTDTAKVTGIITVSGTANLVSNGLLTLTSNATTTASIGTSTGTVTGNVNWERYIPASTKALYRFLAIPLTNVTFAGSIQKQIHITGAGTGSTLGTFNSNGFDATASNNASAFWYDETAGGGINTRWKSISGTSITVNAARGYRIFVRGNKVTQGNALINGSVTAPEAVTLKATGTVQQGDVNVPLTFTGSAPDAGWNFVANPYPSAVDWNNAAWVSARASMSAVVYIYNPNQNKYAAWSSVSGTGVNGGSNIIASGQSFWVKTTAATTLAIKEAYKSTNGAVGFFSKNGGPVNNLKMQLSDASKVLDETVVFMYNNATKGFDEDFDAMKPDATGTGTISTYTSLDNNKLVFNAIPALGVNDTTMVAIYTPLSKVGGSYKISFEGIETFQDATTQFTLTDNYTGSVVIMSAAAPAYDFTTTDADTASYSKTRFSLMLTSGNGSLPVKFAYFNGKKAETKAVLNWATASEINNDRFEVQKSTDGVHFTSIHTVKGAVNSAKLVQYTFTDASPAKGINYYRLKQVDLNGTPGYSTIVSLNFGNTVTSAISIAPVPAEDHLSVSLHNQYAVSAEIAIIDMVGKTVYNENVTAHNAEYVHTIQLDALKSGVYFIQIKQAGGATEKIKFIKN